MFFGLSLRQLVFSALAVAVAVGLYFLLKPCVGTETVSWMCIVGAAPFAALGFFTYHGMTAEQFIWAWLRSEVLEPRELRFESSTLYYDILKSSMEKREKEEYKRHD
ncbi:PrgI family protein [Oscillospiraceae bacterium 50-58]